MVVVLLQKYHSQSLQFDVSVYVPVIAFNMCLFFSYHLGQWFETKVMMTNFLLLFRRIYNHYKNIYLELQRNSYPKLMKRLNEFFKKQNIWIRKQIVRFPNDPLWRHVNYVITQLDGLMAGYRSIKSIVSA